MKTVLILGLFILLVALSSCKPGSKLDSPTSAAPFQEPPTIFTEAIDTQSPTITETITSHQTEVARATMTKIAKSQTETNTAAPSTHTPQITPSPQPAGYEATQNALATLSSVEDKCESYAKDCYSQMSPEGNWIAAVCRGTSESKGSYLRVFNINQTIEWELFVSDYSVSSGLDPDDLIYPFYWTQNGRYLYATAPSRCSGWCGLGPGGTFLVRLDLKTGQQTEVIPMNKTGMPQKISIAFSPNDRYMLYIRQSGNPYKVNIVDLGTWQSKEIEIAYPDLTGAGNAVWSPSEGRIVLLTQTADKRGGDIRSYSVVLVELEKNAQNRLLTFSDADQEVLYPIQWTDEDHVILAPYDWIEHGKVRWLLNVNTGKMVEYALEEAEIN